MMKFRNPLADEIKARCIKLNRGGAQIYLYKDSLYDKKVLNEAGVDWSDNVRIESGQVIASVEVYIDGKTIRHESIGQDLELGFIAAENDAFKKACFSMGIGAVLYTAPEIFFWRSELKNVVQGRKGNEECHDQFRVADIKYSDDGDSILSVTITDVSSGVTKSFPDAGTVQNTIRYPVPAAIQQPQEQTHKKESPYAPRNEAVPIEAIEPAYIKDETVLLIGSCAGKTYGEVKNSPEFRSFLEWTQKKNTALYKDMAKNQQLRSFKMLADYYF